MTLARDRDRVKAAGEGDGDEKENIQGGRGETGGVTKKIHS
jgi:hypothetical protein